MERHRISPGIFQIPTVAILTDCQRRSVLFDGSFYTGSGVDTHEQAIIKTFLDTVETSYGPHAGKVKVVRVALGLNRDPAPLLKRPQKKSLPLEERLIPLYEVYPTTDIKKIDWDHPTKERVVVGDALPTLYLFHYYPYQDDYPDGPWKYLEEQFELISKTVLLDALFVDASTRKLTDAEIAKKKLSAFARAGRDTFSVDLTHCLRLKPEGSYDFSEAPFLAGLPQHRFASQTSLKSSLMRLFEKDIL